MGDSTLKCVLVGDDSSGKTCMLITYTTGEFPTSGIPMVFDTCTSRIDVDTRPYNVTLSDTGIHDDYRRLRRMGSFNETDVVLVCFSVTSSSALENVYTRWIPEVENHYNDCALLLVGTKIDTREKRHKDSFAVTREQGEQIAEEVGAVGYAECSAQTQEGLDNVFQHAVRAALTPKETRQQLKANRKKRKKKGKGKCDVM